MSPADQETLEQLRRRLDHTAAIATMLASAVTGTEGPAALALQGVGETLTELAGRLDGFLSR